MAVIEKGSLVLVTGSNGYIASHVCDQLLEAGFRVRGTVRSKKKAKWLYELFDKKYGVGSFEAVDVPDMTAENAYGNAVKGVSGIAHVASVLTFSNKVDEVIPVVVKGTLEVFNSALKEPSVKSFVLTSSSTAAVSPVPNKEIMITQETWNDSAVKAAYENKDVDGVTVYGASKTEGERALWKAVEEKKPSFQVSAVLPNWNMGEILQPNGAMSSSTASFINGLFKGDATCLWFPPQWFVDVKDNARLHVIALTDPGCNHQRIFAFAEPFYWDGILSLFRKWYPDRTFPTALNQDKDLTKVPGEEAEALLRKHYGKGWTSLEECLKANIAQAV